MMTKGHGMPCPYIFMRKTIQEISDKKKKGEKITMLTAYDYPTAALADAAGWCRLALQ